MKNIFYLISIFNFIVLNNCFSQNWEVMQKGEGIQTKYSSHSFFDKDFGWCISHKDTTNLKLLKTTNGGLSWEVIKEKVMPGMLKFWNVNEGIYCGKQKLFDKNNIEIGSEVIIQSSNDGGQSWNVVERDSLLYSEFKEWSIYNRVSDLQVIGKSIYISTYVYMYVSHDLGKTFFKPNLKNLPQSLLIDVSFVDEANGWASLYWETDAQETYLARTLDSGRNWENINTVSYPTLLFNLQFINKSLGYFCDIDIFKLTNGGLNWSKINTNITSSIYNCFFIDSLYGYAASRDSIYRTNNGGRTFRGELELPYKDGLVSFEISQDKSTLWATTFKGSVLRNVLKVSGVEEAITNSANVTITPNPARGRALLGIAENSGGGVVLLYNTLGQEVQRVEFGNETNVSLDLMGLSTGCYNAIIKTKRGVAVKKIVVVN